MNVRALARLLLIAGSLILFSSLVMARIWHTEDRTNEVMIIAAIALGAFLTITGLNATVTEPEPAPMMDEADEPVVAGAGPSAVRIAIGVYLFVLAIAAGIVVGVAQGDSGAGIQTFTAGVIFGGVIFGIGFMLGHRPAEEA